MHDLLLAKEILEAVKKYSREQQMRSVTKVIVGLGKITGGNLSHNDRLKPVSQEADHFQEEITPENLKYNFNLVKKGTIADLAVLIIKTTADKGWRLQEIYGK